MIDQNFMNREAMGLMGPLADVLLARSRSRLALCFCPRAGRKNALVHACFRSHYLAALFSSVFASRLSELLTLPYIPMTTGHCLQLVLEQEVDISAGVYDLPRGGRDEITKQREFRSPRDAELILTSFFQKNHRSAEITPTHTHRNRPYFFIILNPSGRTVFCTGSALRVGRCPQLPSPSTPPPIWCRALIG